MSLLQNATYANPTTAYFSSGGGGGGGGANPNFSSISLQANGDINWDGSLNFQGTSGGYVSFFSTFAGLSPANGISITGAGTNNASTLNLYIGASGQANLEVLTPNQSLTMPGVNLGGLSTLTVSSINGQAQPVTIGPNQSLTYVKGGGSANLFSLTNQIAQHIYRMEFPIKVQGWNATDGNSNTYAPAAGDFLTIYPFGNVAGSPAPVFTTLQMAQVSSLNNDWEGTVSCVWKCSANGAQTISVDTVGATYSTSVEIGGACIYQDLGVI